MSILILDTETASLKGGVLDLAVIEVDEDLNVLNTIESLIDPQCPIAPAAQAVHGISSAMVADAPTMAEFITERGNPFAVEPLYLFGHNVQFDIRALAAENVLPIPYTKICTLRMARNLWPDLKEGEENHKLGTLAVMFGLEIGTAHRAMGDAITCLNLLRYIADFSGVGSFKELCDLGRRPLSLQTRITFGKHKGTTLEKLPMDYVRWMRNQPDMDQDLIAALAVRK